MKFAAPAIPDFKLLSKMYLADNNMPVLQDAGMHEPRMHRTDCTIISNPKSGRFCLSSYKKNIRCAAEPIAGNV